MLSIITISKNDPSGLERTLTSTQTIANVEQIVVLGGGCQESFALAKRFCCIILQQTDQGIAAAFNLGLTRATGLGVMFLNGGDTLLEPAMVAQSLHLLRIQPEVDILLYDVIFDDALVGPYQYRVRTAATPRLDCIGLGMPGSHQAMVVRRSSFEQVGQFDTRYQVAMDYDWLCRWHHTASPEQQLAVVTFPPVARVDGKGISISQEPRCLYECYQALRRHGLFKGRYAIDYLNRLTRFAARMALMKLRLSGLVMRVKQWKHL
jgi:glycosyltransferase